MTSPSFQFRLAEDSPEQLETQLNQKPQLTTLPFKFRDVDEELSQIDQDKFQKEQDKQAFENIPFGDVLRHLGQYGARGVEGAIGIPGDVFQAVKALSQYLPNVPKILEGLGNENIAKESLKKIGEKLPTTESAREFTKELTGEKFEPQNEYEEIVGNIIQDATKLGAGGFNFIRSIATSTLGNLTKEGIKEFGGSPTQQELAKVGVMIASSLIDPAGAKKYAAEKFSKAYEAIPQGQLIPSTEINKEVSKFIDKIQKGGISPQKQPAYNLAKQLKKSTSGDLIEAFELPQYRQSLNDFRFNKDLNESAHRWLNDLDGILNKSLQNYGKTNPEFLKNYREANQIYSGIKQGFSIEKKIGKALRSHHINPDVAYALGFLHNPSKFASRALSATGISETVNFFNRIKNNPAFRKYYLQTLKAGAEGNSPQIINSIRKLEKEYKKSSAEE